jgi:hypothetical protein
MPQRLRWGPWLRSRWRSQSAGKAERRRLCHVKVGMGVPKPHQYFSYLHLIRLNFNSSLEREEKSHWKVSRKERRRQTKGLKQSSREQGRWVSQMSQTYKSPSHGCCLQCPSGALKDKYTHGFIREHAFNFLQATVDEFLNQERGLTCHGMQSCLKHQLGLPSPLPYEGERKQCVSVDQGDPVYRAPASREEAQRPALRWAVLRRGKGTLLSC